MGDPGSESEFAGDTHAAFDRFTAAQDRLQDAQAAQRDAWEAARQAQLAGETRSRLEDANAALADAKREMAAAATGAQRASDAAVDGALRERYGADGPTAQDNLGRGAEFGGSMVASAATSFPGAVWNQVTGIAGAARDAAGFVRSHSLRENVGAITSAFRGPRDPGAERVKARADSRRALEQSLHDRLESVRAPAAAGERAGAEVADLAAGFAIGGVVGKAAGVIAKGASKVVRRPWEGATLAEAETAASCASCAPKAPKYETRAKSIAYQGEQHAGVVWPTAVKYLDATERQAYKLKVKQGRLYDADGHPFDTRHARAATGDRAAIVVMDAYGDFYASTTQTVGQFHHSSFLAGGDVAFAGEISVKKGYLQSINRKSGHYRPTEKMLENAVTELESKGVDMSGVTVERGY